MGRSKRTLGRGKAQADACASVPGIAPASTNVREADNHAWEAIVGKVEWKCTRSRTFSRVVSETLTTAAATLTTSTTTRQTPPVSH